MHRASTAPCWQHMLHCSIYTPRTKWLRIDCSNLFTLRWGGSVSRPKITLKSDYIQFLTSGTNNFSSWLPARRCACLCVCGRAHMHMCSCAWVACVLVCTFFVCVYFRRRSFKRAWSYWGTYWAAMRAVRQTFPTALRFITEWLTQALLYSPLNSFRPSSLLRRCVLIFSLFFICL